MHNLTKITYNQYCPYNLPNEKYIAVQKTKVQLWKVPQVKTSNKTGFNFQKRTTRRSGSKIRDPGKS